MEYLKIIPEPDEYLWTARSLLAIVGPGRAHEVEAVTYPGRGFRVPADVAIEHVRRVRAASEPAPVAPKPAPVPSPAPVIPAPAPAPAKRTPKRRG